MCFEKSKWLLLIAIAAAIVIVTALIAERKKKDSFAVNTNTMSKGFEWKAPDTNQIAVAENGQLIRYGRELIAHTSFYLGPKGSIAATTNGMNCQNCHLEAGTKPWGNNYSAVFATYPRFRERSGTIENIYKRVNDCIERSLNGKAIDTNSREMQAISSYIQWLGSGVPRGTTPAAAGIKTIPFLKRAADPTRGKMVYWQNCQRCHGPEGKGLLNTDSTMYIYPPLWGDNSYNTGAGLYRISRLAGYVKENMPFDAPQKSRHLTDEEAWDVAAFINSQPRPGKEYKNDWPDIARKPFDHPFGPYIDSFSEQQHKYGPYEPVRQLQEKMYSKQLNPY
ncbi:MAG: c-type cytochrome [Bacteroidota bacterium]|nr:c-type cytochrome [Bacteroidota bacterium]